MTIEPQVWGLGSDGMDRRVVGKATSQGLAGQMTKCRDNKDRLDNAPKYIERFTEQLVLFGKMDEKKTSPLCCACNPLLHRVLHRLKLPRSGSTEAYQA